ncbi:MAG: hypothetical protein NT114_03790 [Patescibacteria group bacterium]|nr:hypothetical protein [Patescibacteria group bacterium]
MSDINQKWDSEIERWDPRRVKIAIAVFIAVVLVAPIAIWGIRVTTSDTRGAGNVEIERNSAENRVRAQAYFEQSYQDIKKFDVQIVDAQKAYNDFVTNNPKPSADDLVAAQIYGQQLNSRQVTLTGLQQQCQNTVANYDAEARKTLAAEWRSNELPYQIDSSPETDCK